MSKDQVCAGLPVSKGNPEVLGSTNVKKKRVKLWVGQIWGQILY